MDFKGLAERERAQAETQTRNGFTLKIHRAISWGLRAEIMDDFDMRFICYWISFNSIYGGEFGDDLGEKTAFKDFLVKVCELDTTHRIAASFGELANHIRVLVSNKYLYESFWDFYSNKLTSSDFESRFERFRMNTIRGQLYAETDSEVIRNIFCLIYVLRNQIFHGSATYNSGVNREQVKTSVYLLEHIMPIIVEIVMNNPNEAWSEPNYPVVTD